MPGLPPHLCVPPLVLSQLGLDGGQGRSQGVSLTPCGCAIRHKPVMPLAQRPRLCLQGREGRMGRAGGWGAGTHGSRRGRARPEQAQSSTRPRWEKVCSFDMVL